MQLARFAAAVVICVLTVSAADLTSAERRLNTESFEYAWKTIARFMWQPMPVDWQAVHDELKPKVEAAATMESARAVMDDMISRLKMTHFAIVPADTYDRLDAARAHAGGGGYTGFDIRLVDGEATVSAIQADCPAYHAGVRPGWRILQADGSDTRALVGKLRGELPPSTVQEFLITRAIVATFDGIPRAKIPAEFLDGRNDHIKLNIELTGPRGMGANIGFLPLQHVWYESKKTGDAGYIRFNMFLDPARISTAFGDSIQSFMHSAGIVIDLRGNPGGISGMALGMAGWLIDKPGVRLGILKTKETELKFVVNPRAEVYRGPVAILVDGLTASTSEIFAGGLKDLGRARIFGTRTAGAALPSVFERLPNGDGFQYAIANYTSEGGEPLEGIGVKPDVEVPLSREALLGGHDPALEAALAWIGSQARNGKERHP